MALRSKGGAAVQAADISRKLGGVCGFQTFAAEGVSAGFNRFGG